MGVTVGASGERGPGVLFSRRLKWAITGGLFYNCQLHNALGLETSCGRMRLSVALVLSGFVVNDGWGVCTASGEALQQEQAELNCGDNLTFDVCATHTKCNAY
jgi:hypothetical protein